MVTVYVANKQSVVFESFDDESVLINFNTGTYFSLRGTAPDVWRLLESPITIDGIARRIGAEQLENLVAVEAMIRTLVNEDCILVHSVEHSDIADEALPGTCPGLFTPPRVNVFHDLKELIIVDPVHEVDSTDGWPHRPPPFALD